MGDKFCLTNSYVRYEESRIMEDGKRNLNNHEVCWLMNNQERTIKRLEEKMEEYEQYVRDQHSEIRLLRKKVHELSRQIERKE